MEKQCCSANVTELENGYRLEITGQDVKEKLKPFLRSAARMEI